ncbi:MAG: hypothetical protein ABIG34_05115 [Candidatus Peregrinibacteria bacterium]
MHIKTLIITGSLSLIIAVCSITPVEAAESASFQFIFNPVVTVSQDGDALSPSYRWKESEISWQARVEEPQESNEEAAPADTTSSSGDHTNAGGTRRAVASVQAPSPSPSQNSPQEVGANPSPPPQVVLSPVHAPSAVGATAVTEIAARLSAPIPAAKPSPVPKAYVAMHEGPVPPTSTQANASTAQRQTYTQLAAQLLNGTGLGAIGARSALILLGSIALGFLISLVNFRRSKAKNKNLHRRKSHRRLKKTSLRHFDALHPLMGMKFFAMLLLCIILPSIVAAETSVPQRLHYSGSLYDSEGAPIATQHFMRFSLWTSADALSDDRTASGAITLTAAAYAGWQEVQSVTPDAYGQLAVELGSVTSLPDFDSFSSEQLLNLVLQVEVRASGTSEADFEILDPDSSDDTEDRFAFLSVPFALNADKLDRREVGTGSGAIPLLGSGGLLPLSMVPLGTNQESFTINAQNTAADAVLTFGNDLLPATIRFSAEFNRFEFSHNLYIDGDVTASGALTVHGNAQFNSTMTINGVTYTFPVAEAVSGSVLKTNGSGNLSWSDDHNAPATTIFVDTTTESLTDENVDLWDGTYPSVTLSKPTNRVLVNVLLNGTADAGDGEIDAFTVHRAIDADPTCSDTIVGGIFSSTFTTRKYDTWSASASLIDDPSTTENVRYTVCSSTAATTGGTISNDTSEIHMSLIQLGN